LVVFAAAVMLVVAGCGSSGKSSAGSSSKPTTAAGASQPTTAAGGSSGSVRGFNGTTLTVSGFGDAHDFAGADAGAIAYFDALNANGGVDGIKIKDLGFANDNLDPSTALSEARLMVTSQNVFAVVPDLSPVNPGQYFAQEQVPYVGWAFDATYCSPTPSTSLWGFSYDGCGTNPSPSFVGDKYAALYKYAVSTTGSQHPSLLMFTEDTAAGQSGLKQAVTSSSGIGFQVIKGENLPQNATDFTPYIQSWLTAAGGKAPDVIDCESGTQCVGVYTALRADGYKGIYSSYSYSPSLMKTMAGSVVITLYNTQPNAGLTQLNQDLQKYQPNAQFTAGVAATYFAAAMFTDAVKSVVDKGGKGALTPVAVQQALARISFQIPDLVGPTHYPDSTVTSVPYCSALLMYTTTQFNSLEPYACSSRTYRLS
jgi:ABC-type branched-subunit amino acid transport system substrate-binding protein